MPLRCAHRADRMGRLVCPSDPEGAFHAWANSNAARRGHRAAAAAPAGRDVRRGPLRAGREAVGLVY